MDSMRAEARRAGVLYLLLGILGPINLIYIPTAFIVPGNAAATAHNILAGQLTYRLAIVSEIVADVVFLVLVSSLYNLLEDVNRTYARLMVILVSVGVAVGVANLFAEIAPLVLLSGADFLSVFTKAQLDALALGGFRLHGIGTQVVFVFWALWLFPFGILVFRSGFFPKLLGILLVVGCFAYLAVSFTALVFPAYRAPVAQVALPFYSVGELSMIVWLLVKGVNVQPLEQEAR